MKRYLGLTKDKWCLFCAYALRDYVTARWGGYADVTLGVKGAKVKRIPIKIDGHHAWIESIGWTMTYLKDDSLDVRISLDEPVGCYSLFGEFEISLPVKEYHTPTEFLNAVRVGVGARLRVIIEEDPANIEVIEEDRATALDRKVAEIKDLIGLD